MREIEALCIMHGKLTQSSECRDFSHRTALLLEKQEEAGLFRMADRVMDLLASCNPKLMRRQSPSAVKLYGNLKRG